MTRKLILLTFILLAGFLSNIPVFGQNVVVSSYLNAGDPRDEWSEILVIGDNISLYNFTFRDNNSSQTGWQTAITFSNAAFWSNMRAGTIIIIWHRRVNISGVDHPQDITKNDGYLELWANDPVYFTGGDFGSPPLFNGNSLNVAGGGDILQLRNAGGTHIHALGHITTPGSTWTALPPPKLNHSQTIVSGEAISVCPGSNISEYGTPPQNGTTYTSKSSSLLTKGLPNQCAAGMTANSDYWRSIRQPDWTSPILNLTFTAPSTVNLDWTAGTDPNPSDNTQGYLVLRNPVNSFTAPNDGQTYSVGETIGTASVIAVIPSSQTLTYTDTYTLNCGDTAYYRVYAFRYAIDNMNGNNFNVARGRAYNETSFGAGFTGIPDAPLITNVSHTDALCGLNNGTITITATGVAGVTLEYSINGTDWFPSNVFTDLPPGSYTVYVRIAGFVQCQVPYGGNPVVVDDMASPTFIQVDHTDASCGVNNGSITITASGGTPPLQYSIDNGSNWQASNIFPNLAPNSYTVVITDANNCQVDYLSNPVDISMIPSPVDPESATVDRNNLCSDDSGDIVLTATGGSGETLQWFTGSCGGTPAGSGSPLTIPSPVVTTTYFVYWTTTVCGNSSCASVTVNVVDPPTASEAGPDQSLCGLFSTQLAGNQPVSGTGLWTQITGPGSSTFADNTLYNTQVTVTVYGSYTFRWTISTGTECPVSLNEVVITFSDEVLVTAGSNSPVCTGNTIFLTSSITGATYSWTGPDGFTSTEQNPSIPNSTLANEGTYTVTVSNIPGGCPNTLDGTDVDIVESPIMPASAAADPPEVCEGAGGDIQLTATGGSGTILTWFEGSCGGTVIGTGNGLVIPAPLVTTTYYAAWGTDECGDSECAETTVTVAEPPATADAGGDQSLCGVLLTVMDANDPSVGTGLWTVVSGPGAVSFSDPAAWDSQVTVTAQGIYVLSWNITNGPICPASSDEITLNFDDAIQVVAASNSPVCTELDINLTSSIAGATYLWTGPGGFTSTQQNPVITNAPLAAAGTYTVQVTNIPGGCPDTQNSTDVIVNQSAAEPVSVTSSLDVICEGFSGDLVLTANGGSGITLEWFSGICGGTMIGTGASLTIPAPLMTTTYFARWTTTECGSSECKSVTVTIEQPPTTANAGPDQSICNNLTTTLQANVPLNGSGQWTTVSGPGTILYSDPASPGCFITASNIGIFTLRWTISTGGACPASEDEMTVEFGNQIIVVASSNSPVCEGEDITLFSSIAGATYDWTGPGGFISNQQNPVISNANITNSGLYSVTVSDIPGGCPSTSNTTTVVVGIVPAAPSVNSQNINGSMQDVCAGSVVTYSIVSPVAGSDYTWNLSGGGTIQPSGSPDMIDITWFAPNGTYDLSVTETSAEGCTGQAFLLTVNVIQATYPSLSISADQNPVCPGTAVQFTALVTDGGLDPVYRWTKNGVEVGGNDSIYILDSPVDYDFVSCAVTSSDICAVPPVVIAISVELSVYDPVMVSIAPEEPICAGTPTVISPGSGYSGYLWSTGSTESSITVSTEGIYWVEVTDNNGCTGIDTVRVEPCETLPLIYAPNAFSPNADGKNDRFFLVCSNPDLLTGFELIIYNRWGQMIFQSNDIGEGWDGMVDGKPSQSEVYTYIATYSYSAEGGGTGRVAGLVTLIR